MPRGMDRSDRRQGCLGCPPLPSSPRAAASLCRVVFPPETWFCGLLPCCLCSAVVCTSPKKINPKKKKKKTATPRCGCLRLSAHFSMRRVLSTIFPAHSICRFPARSPPGPIAVFPDYSTDIPTLQIRGYHSGPARGPTFDRLDQPGCPKQSAQERRAPAASAN